MSHIHSHHCSVDRLRRILRRFGEFVLAWFLVSGNLAALGMAQEETPDFIANPDAISREDRIRAGSLYEAFFANHQGLESGDVLIRQMDDIGATIVVDEEDGKTSFLRSDRELKSSEVVFYRFRFDRQKGRFLFVRAMSGDAFFISEAGLEDAPRLKDEIRFGAFVAERGGKCYTRIGDFPAGEAGGFDDQKGLELLFRNFKVPSLNASGIVTFGWPISEAQIEASVARLASGDTISRIESIDAGRTRITRDEKMSGGVPARTIAVYDLVRLVPASRSIYLQAPSGQWVFSSKEEYRWSEIGGMSIPASITRKYQGQKELNGTVWIGDGLMRFDFHWFSVNEEMRGTDFDPAIIRDHTTCIRMADPAASKADSLLPQRSTDVQGDR